MKLTLLAGSTAVAVAVLLVGCAKPPATEAAPEAAPVPVELAKSEVKPMRKLLHLRGSFVPTQGSTARIAPSGPGRLTQVLVREGDSVHVGQLLATLDTGVQVAMNTSAQAAAASAQAAATSSDLAASAAVREHQSAEQVARLGLDAAQATRNADIAQAEIALASATADFQKTKAGARPQELAQAHQATIQSQVALNKAKADYDRNVRLAKEGYVATKTLEESRSTLEQAVAALASSNAAENLMKAGARPEDLKTAQLRVDAARTALADVRKMDDQRIAAARLTLQQAQQSNLVQSKAQDAMAARMAAQQKSADASAAAASVGLAQLKSPLDGRVSRRLLNPGDLADTTNPVLEIASSGAVDFVGTAPADQATGASRGMAAFVTFGSGEQVQGRVVNVSPADPMTGLSSIRIVTSAKAVIGQSASADVVEETHPHAIAVPTVSVLTKEGKSVVFLADGGTAKQTEVTVGVVDGDDTEILKGVSAGVDVVKLGQFELTDGVKIEEAKAAPAADEKAGGDKAADEKGAPPDDKSADKSADKPAETPAKAGSK